MPSLRNDLIRLAHAQPELRETILPMVTKARYNPSGWARQVSQALQGAYAEGAATEAPSDMPNYPVADSTQKSDAAIRTVHTLLKSGDPDTNKLAAALVEAMWWMGKNTA